MLRSFALALILVFGWTAPALQAQETFLGKTADAWAQQLKTSANEKDRRNAAFALGKMGSQALNFLADMKSAYAQASNAKIRETLVFALGDICRDTNSLSGDFELQQLFLTALKDSDPLVRRSAAYALGCLGNTSGAIQDALSEALHDTNSLVRQNAAWAFGSIGKALGPNSAPVVSALSKALKDGDSLVKRDAASSLLVLNNPSKVRELVPDLLPLCSDGNSEVRRAALNVLVSVVTKQNQQAIPALLAALKDSDLENKRNAALALSNIGGMATAAAVPVLLEAARNGDLELRRQAVLAFRNIGPAAEDAIPDLMGWLREDKDAKIREYAAMSLGGIGKKSEPAIPLFLEKIVDKKETRETRAECLTALVGIGFVPSSNLVATPLLKLLADSNEDAGLRQFASWALRIHHSGKLVNTNGAFETFSKVVAEPAVRGKHLYLRYECAYTLGFFWKDKVSEKTLDVLYEYICDTGVLFIEKSDSGVGGASAETKSGIAKVQYKVAGDARSSAVDALERIGVKRFSRRVDIMQQLKVLAENNNTFEPLRKHAARLLKAAESEKS